LKRRTLFIAIAMAKPTSIKLPAVVLVTRRSTYAVDAEACVATWTATSLAKIAEEDSAHVRDLVRRQLKDVMPLMFSSSSPIAEPVLAEVKLVFGFASIRVIVQMLPELAA
jgi:hypothetical protein